MICLAFVLVPTSALSARPHGAAAKARAATNADDAPKGAAGALPPAVAAILRGSGLPTTSFAFDVRAVDGIDAAPLVAFHAEQPFLLASTTKVVTSLAALDLLGPRHRWRTSAYATGPLVGGRLGGDLVIVGGPVGLTGNELRRWFRQMRAEGSRRSPATSSSTTWRCSTSATRSRRAPPSRSELPARRSTRAPTTSASCSSR